jgi:hypothetical protein
VFLLERQRKAVDDRAEDLKQLCNAVVAAGQLVNEPGALGVSA